MSNTAKFSRIKEIHQTSLTKDAQFELVVHRLFQQTKLLRTRHFFVTHETSAMLFLQLIPVSFNLTPSVKWCLINYIHHGHSTPNLASLNHVKIGQEIC